MKLSPKFILAFVLLMLSFSMGGNAMNFSAYASNCEASWAHPKFLGGNYL